MSELNTTLDDLISNGVALDLFEAKQARMLLDHLGLNAVAINTKGFGRIFGQLQTTLERSFVLMLCRLLEREVQKYKIRSIPAALKFLDENHETSQILNRPHIVEFMMQRGFDHAPLNALPDSELTSALVSEFHSILPISDEREHDLGEAISQLRTIRDKGIAHHEVVEVSELPSVKRYDIDALMEGVSELIDVVGPSYLAVHHDLDRDVKKTESSLEKLLRAAGVYS